MTTKDRPHVVMLSLDGAELFCDLYSDLFLQLATRAKLQMVTSPDDLGVLTTHPLPSAVLVTDELLTLPEHRDAWESVQEYATLGGAVVLAGVFAALFRDGDLDVFFARAGLPWRAGTECRTTVALNLPAVPPEMTRALPRTGDRSARFIRHVSPLDAWYLTTPDSVRQDLTAYLLGRPVNVHDPTQSPVAVARFGKGTIGYVGHTSRHPDSDRVVLVMCGLLTAVPPARARDATK